MSVQEHLDVYAESPFSDTPDVTLSKLVHGPGSAEHSVYSLAEDDAELSPTNEQRVADFRDAVQAAAAGSLVVRISSGEDSSEREPFDLARVDTYEPVEVEEVRANAWGRLKELSAGPDQAVDTEEVSGLANAYIATSLQQVKVKHAEQGGTADTINLWGHTEDLQNEVRGMFPAVDSQVGECSRALSQEVKTLNELLDTYTSGDLRSDRSKRSKLAAVAQNVRNELTALGPHEALVNPMLKTVAESKSQMALTEAQKAWPLSSKIAKTGEDLFAKVRQRIRGKSKKEAGASSVRAESTLSQRNSRSRRQTHQQLLGSSSENKGARAGSSKIRKLFSSRLGLRRVS